MSNRKSLGSSPIGHLPDETETMDFIPDLRGRGENGRVSVSARETSPDCTVPSEGGESNGSPKGYDRGEDSTYRDQPDDPPRKKAEKKIVSYYLEKRLIRRIKAMADDSGSYYSAVAGEALLDWVKRHGY